MNSFHYPKGFSFGVATSAYQIEGAAKEDGRGPSIWDLFSHTPGRVVDGDTGDVACNHYHLWREDLDLIASLGVDAYRFSIAWPRVQPAGFGAWNRAGLAFYDRLVDGLLERGIQPHATLYHWDLPLALQANGGWLNRDTCWHFAEYAEQIGRHLGDRLASIATHNEPWCTAVLGHEQGKFAPGMKDPKAAVLVAHHLLLSHGLALTALRNAGVKAPLGIVLNQSSATPATGSAFDQALAEYEYAQFVRWFMDPIFFGRYPASPRCELLPDLDESDFAMIGQPLDFLGVNYYTRIWASSSEPRVPPPSLLGESDMGWEIYPQGLTELLVGLKRDYPDLPPIYITENGIACADSVDSSGQVRDTQRVAYLESHLKAMRDAIAAGVDVRGYFYWSLLDNFEWDSGYRKRFGLVYVDYLTQRRLPKESAHWYRDHIAAVRRLPAELEA